MKTTTMPVSNALILPFILGVIIVAITYAALTGKQLPLINGPRAAMIALLVVGMTMCALGGIGQVGASGRWASPLAIVGYILGIVILVVFVGGMAGWKLPLIERMEDGVLAMAALMGAKTVIGLLGYFLRLL